MEANGPVQSLAAMRLRTLLRRSIDALRSAFRAVPSASPSSTPTASSHSEKSSAEAEGTERDADYWNRTLAVLKQDYYALLNESEEHLDRLADILPGTRTRTRTTTAHS
jgi:phosphoenolpyruvate carboxylase